MADFEMKKMCNMYEMCMGMQMMCEPFCSAAKFQKAKTVLL